MRFRLATVAAWAMTAWIQLPAAAGLDVDFGAAVHVNDRTDLYFAVSSRYFGQDEAVVRRAAPRYVDPDDLAVALFICHSSGRPLDEIDGLRRRGLSWWDVSVRVGIPVNAWFVAVPRDPGPPYGKAYGHWKKHRRNSAHHFVIADADARNLVAARVLHEYYGVGIDIAMEWRASGRALPVLIHDEYHKRHGSRVAGSPSHHAADQDDGKSKSKSKGKHKNH